MLERLVVRRQWWVAQALIVAILTGGSMLAGGMSTWAESAVSAGSFVKQSAEQSSLSAEVAAEMRNRVLVLAKTHPAAEVRVSAWNALRSSRGDEALVEWFAPGGGFEYAK